MSVPSRFLFVKESLAWPRAAGHDVHCHAMMRALAERGAEVSLLTAEPPRPEAITPIPLHRLELFQSFANNISPKPLIVSKLQRKFIDYWGVEENRIAAVSHLAEQVNADVVVGVGLEALPYLASVDERQRVWYAADEWAWHHLSMFRPWWPGSWGNVKEAAIKGLYERAFRSKLDRVWVVSKADQRAMRIVSGIGAVDLVPNGVDSDHFRPVTTELIPNSCVFWGRLDFGPNIDAIRWFTAHVWPSIRRRVPTARLSLYGFHPTDEVRALDGMPGVELIADLPDLRSEICRRSVVVLPFVSGAGIKNKLLEAASLAKTIIASPWGVTGLDQSRLPFPVVRSAAEWINTLESLWRDPASCQTIGEQSRRWVIAHHSWEAAADAALVGLSKGSS